MIPGAVGFLILFVGFGLLIWTQVDQGSYRRSFMFALLLAGIISVAPVVIPD